MAMMNEVCYVAPLLLGVGYLASPLPGAYIAPAEANTTLEYLAPRQ